MQLKSNIWKLHQGSTTYFAKRLRSHEDVAKIQLIHEKLTQNGFHELVPIIGVEQGHIILQPWQEDSRTANFSIREERTEALQLLRKLHSVGTKIHWGKARVVPRADLLLKWQFRLTRFQNELSALAYYFPMPYLLRFARYAEKALQDIRIAEKALKKTAITLLHGDVVHHNFLICSDGTMRLIDFDLAQLGEADDEMILWMHRVLPNLDYSLPKLMEEQPILRNITKERYHRLKYPNELLREWLYVLTLNTQEREQFLSYLLPFTKSALDCWQQLWEDCEKYAVLQSK